LAGLIHAQDGLAIPGYTCYTCATLFCFLDGNSNSLCFSLASDPTDSIPHHGNVTLPSVPGSIVCAYLQGVASLLYTETDQPLYPSAHIILGKSNTAPAIRFRYIGITPNTHTHTRSTWRRECIGMIVHVVSLATCSSIPSDVPPEHNSF
jgi:hypothetical protein